jgi:hypothetical protein
LRIAGFPLPGRQLGLSNARSKIALFGILYLALLVVIALVKLALK